MGQCRYCERGETWSNNIGGSFTIEVIEGTAWFTAIIEEIFESALLEELAVKLKMDYKINFCPMCGRELKE